MQENAITSIYKTYSFSEMICYTIFVVIGFYRKPARRLNTHWS